MCAAEISKQAYFDNPTIGNFVKSGQKIVALEKQLMYKFKWICRCNLQLYKLIENKVSLYMLELQIVAINQ